MSITIAMSIVSILIEINFHFLDISTRPFSLHSSIQTRDVFFNCNKNDSISWNDMGCVAPANQVNCKRHFIPSIERGGRNKCKLLQVDCTFHPWCARTLTYMQNQL